MGQGQEVIARKHMATAFAEGQWVLLQNTHLGLSYLVEVRPDPWPPPPSLWDGFLSSDVIFPALPLWNGFLWAGCNEMCMFTPSCPQNV